MIGFRSVVPGVLAVVLGAASASATPVMVDPAIEAAPHATMPAQYFGQRPGPYGYQWDPQSGAWIAVRPAYPAPRYGNPYGAPAYGNPYGHGDPYAPRRWRGYDRRFGGYYHGPGYGYPAPGGGTGYPEGSPAR